MVTDLLKDLSDGIALPELAGILSGEKVPGVQPINVCLYYSLILAAISLTHSYQKNFKQLKPQNQAAVWQYNMVLAVAYNQTTADLKAK